MAVIAGVGFTVFCKRFLRLGGTRSQAINSPMPYRSADGSATGGRLAVGGESEGGGQGRKEHQRDQGLAHESSQAGCERAGHGVTIHYDDSGCQSLPAPTTGGDTIPV